jgi:hypothetical protein
MGRVARYKRIKAIDPHNPKTRGVVPEKEGAPRELAPRGASLHRQPLPRSLRALQAVQGYFAGPARPPRAPVPHSMRHIAELPGESLASFKRRVKAEKRRLLAELRDVPAAPPAGAEKPGAALRVRAAREPQGAGAGGGGGGGAPGGGAAPAAAAAGHGDDGGDSAAAPFASRFVDYHPSLLPAALLRAKRKREGGGEAGLDAFLPAAPPAFGERAEAPPRFLALPRNAENKARKHRRAATAAGGGAGEGGGGAEGASAAEGGAGAGAGAAAAAAARRAVEVRAAQVDAARDQARAAFAEMKAKRRAAFAVAAAAAGRAPTGALRAPAGAPF